MRLLLGDVLLGLAFVAVLRADGDLVGVTTLRGRRVPGGAIGLWMVMALTSLAQLISPSVLGALDERPAAVLHHGQPWRLVTAAFVQDGGPAGTVFNLVTLALIGVLADWYWGPRRMLAVFLGAAVLLNVQAAAFGVDTAGSSGATFALGASLAGVLIWTGSGSARGRAITVPLLGVVLVALGNFHGLAIGYGVVIGLAAHGWSTRRSRTRPGADGDQPGGQPTAAADGRNPNAPPTAERPVTQPTVGDPRTR